MKNQNRSTIVRYIIYLIIVLLAYIILIANPFKKNKETSQDITSENIIKLDKSTNQLKDLIRSDKDALDNFFYNDKTYEKIRGLVDTYADDKEFKINDMLILILNQDGSLVNIGYENAEFEIVNSRIAQTDDTKEKTEVVMDVKVIKNPEGTNRFVLIHDLKTYLVDDFGQDAFDNFLDKVIADTINENNELIDKISDNKKGSLWILNLEG